tara:strand:- start:697 stop:1620 length:924 start_codon:yes stop_codon:yes gene_type:complete
MAFLDNSGDIILDAVLTNEGRRRLAKGDGSFSIKWFALGDDEIDYTLYNKNHASGSAYYDLKILQTPVLEAITNSATGLKSHVITILNERKFYMPTLLLNTKESVRAKAATTGSYHIAVTKDSRDKFADLEGTLDGFAPKDSNSFIQVDQGLDTGFSVSADTPLDAEDRETQYVVYMDNRLGELTNTDGRVMSKNFVDEDDIATYYLTLKANAKVVTQNANTERSPLQEVIEGPRGTRLQFKVRSTLNLRNSNYLFDNVGGTSTLVTAAPSSANTNIRFIDSTIRVVGSTTGAKIEVPVRYIKQSSE